MKQIVRVQVSKRPEIAHSDCQERARPVTSERKENPQIEVPRKLNKIEQAKENLIKWIFECSFIE